jgi:hypothetical protein
MRAQIVFAQVPAERREAYLKAWTEWTGTLFGMEIRAQLYESETRPGAFTEFTLFEAGQEAALADDRITRINGELSAAAETRTGALEFHTRVS